MYTPYKSTISANVSKNNDVVFAARNESFSSGKNNETSTTVYLYIKQAPVLSLLFAVGHYFLNADNLKST